ncbi:MAG: hypothetical protein Q9203_005107 [Teloschistes exilis]
MGTFAADDDQADVVGVMRGLLDLTQPRLSGQKGALGIDPVRPPPLFQRHVHDGLMMWKRAEVEAGECHTALDDAEVAASGLEGYGQLFLVANVDFVEFQMDVVERVLGFLQIEHGDICSSGQEGLDRGRADVSRTAGHDDVSALKAEPEVESVFARWYIRDPRTLNVVSARKPAQPGSRAPVQLAEAEQRAGNWKGADLLGILLYLEIGSSFYNLSTALLVALYHSLGGVRVQVEQA